MGSGSGFPRGGGGGNSSLTAPLELPAVSGKSLTTQGGNTLDDGSGNVTLVGTTVLTGGFQNPSGQQYGTAVVTVAEIIGQNGLLLNTTGASVALADIAGKTSAGQLNLRFEGRTTAAITGTVPEAQIFNPAGSGTTYLGISSAAFVSRVPISAPHLNPTPTTPALPANPPVSGTVYQNTTGGPLIITVPITATAVGGSGQWALGSTSTPSDWGGAEDIGVDGETHNMTLYVPNNWYWSLTVTSATIGTASVLGQ